MISPIGPGTGAYIVSVVDGIGPNASPQLRAYDQPNSDAPALRIPNRRK